MIYDYYKEKNSMVSLWLGIFKCSEQLEEYLSDVYQQEDEDDVTFQKKIDRLFIPDNKNRPCENELRILFDNGNCYNQFAYDFGISFNRDFQETYFLKEHMNDLFAILDGFSYFDTFKEPFAHLLGKKLEKKYNAVVLVYNCNYDGFIRRTKHRDFEIEFMGSVPFTEENS